MGRRIVPATIVAALAAFAVAATCGGLSPERPRLWGAAVALVVLGGITPLIFAVNVRILPVFSRRMWTRPRLLFAAMLAAIAGGWLTFLGRAGAYGALETLGAGVALVAGAMFSASVILLFRSAPRGVAPPLPYPEQAAVDRVGVRFTRMAGIYLLIGLLVGFVTRFWTPERGRWDLVWAHALLLGWFLSMASGVCYHVLTRWTTARWRTPRLIPLHLRAAQLALPLMLLALALDVKWLFMLAGPLMALALALLLVNVAPLAWRLPATTRAGVLLAGAYLGVGITLGATFALDPVVGARLRLAHATVNLFGWTTLLVCGVGYYLFPRFAGQVLRWPRLAWAQLGLQAFGVGLGAAGWWWRGYVSDASRPLIELGGALTGLGLLLFALIIGEAFRRSSRTVVAPVTLQPRRVVRPG